MSEIATLLEDDTAYAREARRLMDELHPIMYAAFDEAARLYEFMSNVFVNSDDARLHEYAIRTAWTTTGIPWEEFVRRVAEGDDQPAIAEARERGAVLSRIRAPGVVFLLLWRYFRWAATDICRLRLTAAVGYQRQQAEAVALFWLLREEPALADDWSVIGSDEEGRRFHKRTQRRLREIMSRCELLETYEKGSGSSLHVRITSADRGYRHVLGGVPMLVDAEIGVADLADFHRTVAEFLRTQQRVFRALDPANPERDWELPRLTRQAFDEHLEAVVARLGVAVTARTVK